MKQYVYRVVIEPAEEGGYNVFVPALPGCHTQAETYEEAITRVQEAIEAYLESLAKDGLPIPAEPQPTRHMAISVQVKAPMAAA